jgi:hypothetical protein
MCSGVLLFIGLRPPLPLLLYAKMEGLQEISELVIAYPIRTLSPLPILQDLSITYLLN